MIQYLLIIWGSWKKHGLNNSNTLIFSAEAEIIVQKWVNLIILVHTTEDRIIHVYYCS